MEFGIMFDLLRRSRVRPQAKLAPLNRLALEALEERYALSAAVGLDSTGIPVQDVWSALDAQNYPPVIYNFTAAESGEFWIFAGNVSDPNDPVSGFTVTFGGLPSLNGKTTTVQANGTFSLAVQLGADENGGATAQTIDPHGAASNLATAYVHQTP
jgi:hypothetical protein